MHCYQGQTLVAKLLLANDCNINLISILILLPVAFAFIQSAVQLLVQYIISNSITRSIIKNCQKTSQLIRTLSNILLTKSTDSTPAQNN